VYISLRGCLDRFIDGESKGVVGVVGVVSFLDDEEERVLDEGLLMLLLKYARSLADALRRECSSRMELRVDELHFDLKARRGSSMPALVPVLGVAVNTSSS
jgi:hypothetical protein